MECYNERLCITIGGSIRYGILALKKKKKKKNCFTSPREGGDVANASWRDFGPEQKMMSILAWWHP